jgi:Flp pilus assembly protein TadG
MASLRKRLISRAKDDRGAELIEFALVFPIFLVVFGAMIDFGFLFERFEVVTNAAREGARVAVLPGYGQADAQARASSYLTASGLTESVPAPDVVYCDQTLPSGLKVPVVKVAVQYPASFTFMAPFAGLIHGTAPGALTLWGSSVMRIEGGTSTGTACSF